MQSQSVFLSEKEMLGDMLDQEKGLTKLYASALTETTCPNARQLMLQHIGQTGCDQFDVFDKMIGKGYYQVPDADASAVQMAKQRFTEMKNQL